MIYTNDGKNAMLQGIADKLNTGGNGALAIYINDTLAAELSLLNPAEQSIIDGVMTIKVPPDAPVVLSGVPTSVRLLGADGALLATFDASEVVLDKNQIFKGGTVGLNAPLILRLHHANNP